SCPAADTSRTTFPSSSTPNDSATRKRPSSFAEPSAKSPKSRPACSKPSRGWLATDPHVAFVDPISLVRDPYQPPWLGEASMRRSLIGVWWSLSISSALLIACSAEPDGTRPTGQNAGTGNTAGATASGAGGDSTASSASTSTSSGSGGGAGAGTSATGS